ncbi:MAG TPA: hypothetical protein VHU40_01330, partial [Polyangia bacterium]|nr:hypothetical protein [Polyangia bacterium]
TTYRCNEFGHLCGGQPPPHVAPAAPVTLASCVSAETNGKTDTGLTDPDGNPDRTMGHLWPTVRDFSDFVVSFKSNPDDVLVAAIAGPPDPYVVSGVKNPTTGETVPGVGHSCTDAVGGDFADPAVRIKQWTDSFSRNGLFYPSCAESLAAAVGGIADRLAQKVILRRCLTAAIVDAPDGKPDCEVSEVVGSASAPAGTIIPSCDRSPGTFPCWRLKKGVISDQCPTGVEFKVCRDSACSMEATAATTQRRLTISCATAPSH